MWLSLKLIIELVSIEPIWAEINIWIEHASVYRAAMEQDIRGQFFEV